MKLIVFTDGASRGNPGLASYGFTISEQGGNLIYEEGKYIGITTNNVAEYTGVLEALKKIRQLFTQEELAGTQFYMDSKLAVEQLSGRYRVKSLHLKPIIEEIKILALQLGGVIFTHVPRAKNARADKLANFALDSR